MENFFNVIEIFDCHLCTEILANFFFSTKKTKKNLCVTYKPLPLPTHPPPPFMFQPNR